jgi:FkbM family methyltransferase
MDWIKQTRVEEQDTEGKMVDWMKPLIETKEPFLDIGANAGLWPRHLRGAGFGGDIVAVEACPATFVKLVETLETLDGRNVAVCAAAWEYCGNPLAMSPHDNSGGILFDEQEYSKDIDAGHPCRSTQLADVSTDIRVVSVGGFTLCKHLALYPHTIKIDVEGAELFVVKGLRLWHEAWHGRLPKNIIVEWYAPNSHYFGYDGETLRKELNGAGYRFADQDGLNALFVSE